MAERQRYSVKQLEIVSPDGKSELRFATKNDNTVPSAAEIAAQPIGYVWFKATPTAGDFIGWVKNSATSVKEWGAISA